MSIQHWILLFYILNNNKMIKYLLSNKWGVNQVYIVLTRVCTGWNINSFNMDCFNVSCFHFWNETPNRHNKSFKTFIFRNSIVNMFVLISFPNQAFNRYSKFFVIFKLVLFIYFLLFIFFIYLFFIYLYFNRFILHPTNKSQFNYKENKSVFTFD